MSITSFAFFVFCGATWLAYFLMPRKYRWCVLLGFSFLFYVFNAEPYTIIYLLVSVYSVYVSSLYFERVRESDERYRYEMPRRARLVLIVVLVLNFGLLAALKYMDFFLSNFNAIVELFGAEIGEVNWVASLGISYYTLQMTGYLCDSYWGGKFVPEKNVFKLLLFGMYFPQITSGPISRYDEVSESLYGGNRVKYEEFMSGIQRVLWGLFKKLVVAGRISSFVTTVYDAPHNYSGIYIFLASFAFPMQLYADFSGGMDIIMGVSECFGIHLPENFNAPFFSRSIQEFWQRWHITLGTWLRDYIMYPVLKSHFLVERGEKLKKRYGKKISKKCCTYYGMLCLWLAMGMWHGNGWKYIVGEGVFFWLIIVLGKELQPCFRRCIKRFSINTECFSWRLFQSLRTYLIFSIGLVFFRAVSLPETFRLFRLAFQAGNITKMQSIVGIGLDGWEWFICLLGIIVILIVDFIHTRMPVREALAEQNLVFRWVILLVLIFATLLWGQYGPGYNVSEFIYQGF